MSDLFRNAFWPLIKMERHTWAQKLLVTILAGSIVVNGFYVLVRLLAGRPLFGSANIVNVLLLSIQIGLLIPARLGYIREVTFFLVVSTWIGMTYNAWTGMGVHDSALLVYLLIILAGALVMGWQFVIAMTVLSVVSIWGMAVAEATGARISQAGSPINSAWELSVIFLFAIVLVYMVMSVVRRSDVAMKESDERFGKIFHVSPVATSIIELKSGKLLNANAAYWKLTGLDPRVALGKTVAELHLWIKEENHQHFVREMLNSKSFHLSGFEFVNANGKRRITDAFHELIDAEGEPTVLSMFYDITDQVIARDSLQRSEARLRALLEATPDMIFEFDRDGKILQFVPSSIIDTLIPREEFLGRNIAEIMPPVVVDQTMFAIARTLETGLLQVFEYQLPELNDQRFYEASVTRNDVDTVIAMVRDVTVRNWAATERERLIDQLEAKNAELEQFTYTVSHDLKSPLITIKGFLGYVLEDVRSGNTERLEVDIQRIDDATEKMRKLLNDLLELSRVGRLVNPPERVDMNQLVAETVEFVHGRIANGNIQLQINPNLPSVYVDRQRMLEVLQNLIDNAAKFVGDKPNPVIEIGHEGSLNGMPIFFVKDNGIGISSQFKDRIFGLFNKLDSRTDGTGIGLALVKRIIEYHGGRIWMESELGQGATFFFTLPTPPTPIEATE